MSDIRKFFMGLAAVVLLASVAAAATVAASAPATLDARPFFPSWSSAVPLSCDYGGLMIIMM